MDTIQESANSPINRMRGFMPKEKIGELRIDEKMNEKRLFIMVGLIILILSVSVFRQTIFKVIDLNKENQKKQENLANLVQKASYLESLDTNQLENKVREVEQVFPSQKPALELINALKKLALDNQVTLGAITLNPGKYETNIGEKAPERLAVTGEEQSVDKNALQLFTTRVSVSGEFPKISKFINDLEKTAPLTKINRIDLGIKGQQDGIYIVDLGLEVDVFYQSPPDKLPPVEEPVKSLTSQENTLIESLSSFKFYTLEVPTGVVEGKENPFSTAL